MTDHYYHFVRVNKDGQAYLGYDDNRIVTVGEPVTVGGTPVLCQHGLHASARIIDALEYCPMGNTALCRVELGGEVLHDTGKSVAQTRTIIAMLPVEKTNAILREFARWCALSVVHLWDAPDVVRQYLTTGDESLSEAARAAAAAARAEAADWAWAAWAAEASARAAADAAWAARAAAEASNAWLASARAAWASARSAQEAEIVRLFEAAARAARRATNG